MNKDIDIYYEIERQKPVEKNLVVHLIGLMHPKNILIFMFKLAKYKITLLNQLKD